MNAAGRARGGPAAGVRVVALVAAALVVAGLAGACGPGPGPSVLALQQAAPPVEYHLSFPAPAQRWLAAEVRFPEVGAAPLHVRMSSASPGRYARHEFAKNLIEIAFATPDGGPVAVERRGPAHWVVSGHGGGVRVRYRLFGDRVDGTYLGVDATHAHMNMPATLLWAEGLEERPARVTLEPPDGAAWRAATQLYPTADPLVFTAPNLAYLLDSPIEFSDFALRTFTVADPADPAYRPAFRVAVHHAGSRAAVDAYAAAVERIVRETVPIFGEFPRFETGAYTFIADYLPSASGDAMEHRNSTVLTANAGIDRDGRRLLGSVSHEFFHAWNVERIRPRSLEPFDFTRANVSGALWLGEGFTNYYGALVLQRAGLAALGGTLDRFARVIDTVARGPGRQFRSVVEMSRMAPFTDAATAIDPTNFANTFISYYTWGEAIGLGLDLTLRARSGGRVSLDDYMRALWERFGAPDAAPAAGAPPDVTSDAPPDVTSGAPANGASGAPANGASGASANGASAAPANGASAAPANGASAAPPEVAPPGVVARPYTPADAEAVLGEVAGDPAFAREFFARYIDGREVVDYGPLFAEAGIVLRPLTPGRASLGPLPLGGGMRVTRPTAYGAPLHEAGIAPGDVIVSIDGQRVASASAIERLLRARRPGDRVTIVFRRLGREQEATATLAADGRIELVPAEAAGGELTPAQRAFRAAWLGSRQQ